MKIAEIIIENSAIILSSFGFELQNNKDSNSWTYSRLFENIEQNIVFKKNTKMNGIVLELSTSNNPIPVNVNSLLNNRNVVYWWEYTDTSSLKDVIKSLTDIAIYKGIDYLNIMSKKRLVPTIEMYNKLVEKISNIKTLQSEVFSNSTGLDYYEKIKLIINGIDSLEKDSVSSIMDTLIGYSALIGEELNSKHRGYWDWQHLNYCTNVKTEHDIIGIDILDLVVNYWNNPYLISNNIFEQVRGLDYIMSSKNL